MSAGQNERELAREASILQWAKPDLEILSPISVTGFRAIYEPAFLAGRASLREEVEAYREALKFYGDFKNWRSVTIEDHNRRFCILTGADLEYFENESQNSFCGKTAREVLARFSATDGGSDAPERAE